MGIKATLANINKRTRMEGTDKYSDTVQTSNWSQLTFFFWSLCSQSQEIPFKKTEKKKSMKIKKFLIQTYFSHWKDTE